MHVELHGLRVVITGGASGIGRAIADQFLACGARVHICDVSESGLAEFSKAHPAAGSTLADVADAEAVERLFQDAATSLGGLDALVNNAGISGPMFKPVEEITPSEWERTFAVNINGQFYCTRLAVPLLKQSGGGSILNVSSTAGRMGYPLRTPYSASKWAIIGFTQSLAMELGPSNIRVNALLPGFVDLPRSRALRQAQADRQGRPVAELEREMLQKASLRRRVQPAEVANMAAFVVSRLGEGITGQSLSVCAGTERLA